MNLEKEVVKHLEIVNANLQQASRNIEILNASIIELGVKTVEIANRNERSTKRAQRTAFFMLVISLVALVVSIRAVFSC